MFPTGPYFWLSILITAVVIGLKFAYDRGHMKVILVCSATVAVAAWVCHFVYSVILSGLIDAISSFPH